MYYCIWWSKRKTIKMTTNRKQPLISILVRTCQRPKILKRALDSIWGQTYSNIEVVIVEDGPNISEKFLEQHYAGKNYKYRATIEKVGRSAAGNEALAMATGEYLNFLDDDDMFMEKHVETLVSKLAESSDLAAYSVAEERQLRTDSADPTAYKIKRKTIRFQQPFNRLLLYTFNYFPIQSVMFARTLYDQYGGLDEKLDSLEDWDLWVRYACHTDFIYVNEVTSCYHIPYRAKNKKSRKGLMIDNLEMLYRKFEQYKCTLSVRQINDEMTYVIREYKNKGLLRYLRMFFRTVFTGEQ